ncbi:MAG: hypothetical protein KatS3mg035_0358 [Bacteroidia bacterium]|nr:MAG: hypothetical protein KatS3mg035_0358 [Bacteroidia bacterium]
MYLLTKLGFFSIVRKSFDPIKGEEFKGEEFQVRGIELNDMYNLLNAYKAHPDFNAHKHHVPHIMETHYADYRFRIQVKPEEMSIMFKVLMESIDYMNFKKAVIRNPEQSKKAKVYEKLREDMLSLQKD